MTNACVPVEVSRRIEAAPAAIFELLRHPARHAEFDGSGMLRGANEDSVVSAVGDSFTMKMSNDDMGEYEITNHVVEYDENRRIVWEPVLSASSRDEDRDGIGHRLGHWWGYALTPDGADATVVTEMFDCSAAPDWLRSAVDDGRGWLDAMSSSLEKLAAIV
jgi:uncharacterized protein YndB with AHSA1/START domain